MFTHTISVSAINTEMESSAAFSTLASVKPDDRQTLFHIKVAAYLLFMVLVMAFFMLLVMVLVVSWSSQTLFAKNVQKTRSKER